MPANPEEDWFAGVSVPEYVLQTGCVKEVEVVSIASVANGEVNVEYNSTTYTNVPVLIHSDYGTRRREILGTPLTAASQAFEKSAMHFVLPGGVDVKYFNGSTWLYDPASVDTDPAIGFAIVYPDSESGEDRVFGIIGIKNHLRSNNTDPEQYDPAPDIGAWPTYRPYILLEEAIYDHSTLSTTSTFILYDLINDQVASIPNSDFDDFETANYADSEDDYAHFTTGAVKPLQATVTSTIYAYGTPPYPSDGSYGIGDVSCKAYPGTGSWTSPAWVADYNDTYSKKFDDACGDGSVWTQESVIDGSDAEHTYEHYLYPCTGVYSFGAIFPFSSTSGQSRWSGRTVYSNGFEIEEEYQIEFDKYEAYTSTSSTSQYTFTITININGNEMVYTATRDVRGGDAGTNNYYESIDFVHDTSFTYDSQDSFVGSFTCAGVFLVFSKSTYDNGTSSTEKDVVYGGGLSYGTDDDINGDNFFEYVADRYFDWEAASDFNDNVTYTIDMIFVPYNVREAEIN